MAKRSATSNHYQDRKFMVGKEVGLSIISRGVKWKITAEKIIASMEKRREIINKLNIEVSDLIDRNYGRVNEVVGFTRDFFIKFDNFDRIDPISIEELGMKIIKK